MPAEMCRQRDRGRLHAPVACIHGPKACGLSHRLSDRNGQGPRHHTRLDCAIGRPPALPEQDRPGSHPPHHRSALLRTRTMAGNSHGCCRASTTGTILVHCLHGGVRPMSNPSSRCVMSASSRPKAYGRSASGNPVEPVGIPAPVDRAGKHPAGRVHDWFDSRATLINISRGVFPPPGTAHG